jgi:hypothetical protein
VSADLDIDLDAMNHTELLTAARAMRTAIREHRDSIGHELCWHHPKMWALLPDSPNAGMIVPDWPQFMRGCVRYRQSLDDQLSHAPHSDKEYGQ